jgi:hypothetical protein
MNAQILLLKLRDALGMENAYGKLIFFAASLDAKETS